ncbi:unnamed protein product [Phytomonas sp. EM1]|nr:unnamed protein product [Phytomonas sp. EM1]|eukprot:CCW63258.1 unnamed protein product [Phytomonas sp. isolate EM1]
MPGVKRSADYQLTSENQDDEIYHEYETAPSIASEEELSKRRFLKVRRDAYSTGDAQTTPSTTGGLFKNLRQAAPNPTLNGGASFNFGGKLSNNTNGLDASTSGNGFGIGSKPIVKLPQGDSADAAVSSAPTFMFGSQASSSGATKDTNKPSFSFASGAGNGAAESDGSVEGDKTQQQTGHLFGSSTFSFAGAVKSFVDARKRLEEDRKNATENNEDNALNTEGDDAHHEAKDHESGDTADKFESHSIVARTGEVLVSAPCKLFLFDSKDKKWLDRGESEAKVKREHYDGPETTSGNAPDDACKENSNAAHHCYRLLVRNGYSLNSLIGKNVFVLGKEGPKHIVFSVSNLEGGVANYLLKFTGPNGESNTKKFLEEIRKAMSACEQ